MISRHTLLGTLFDEHPVLVDVLAGYHARFARLRDPQTRAVMAPRVTIAEAAAMAGVAPEALLDVICRALGEVAPAPEAPDARPARRAEPRPEILVAVAPEATVHLDVRDDIKRGDEPFGKIMNAVQTLGDGQVLALRVPFEPFPLYQVLGRHGFAHWTERRAADDCSVWFYRQPTAAGTSAVGGDAPACGCAARRVVIDVRGLEPPAPMARVLEACDRLGPGEVLEVVHERRPTFLYPLLDERGLAHETDESDPGIVRIRIRRTAAR